MKKVTLKTLSLLVVSMVCSNSYTQVLVENKPVKKNSVGISYINELDLLESYEFNYRYYLSNFNLKAGIDFYSGPLRNTTASSVSTPKQITTPDSTGRFYGLDYNYYKRESQIRLKIGAEKVFPSKSNLSLYVGADVYAGLYRKEERSRINYYELASETVIISANEDNNSRNDVARSINNENNKTDKYINITLGVAGYAGLLFNVNDSWEIRASLNSNISFALSKKENSKIDNNSFEADFFPTFNDFQNYLDGRLGYTLGVNYKF